MYGLGQAIVRVGTFVKGEPVGHGLHWGKNDAVREGFAGCQASALLVEQRRRELARLRMSSIEALEGNESARRFLQTAGWAPLGGCRESWPAEFDPLPIVEGRWSRLTARAEETRLFAERIRRCKPKREFMAIANLRSLAGAGAAGRPSRRVSKR
jgi:hypothetical protein